MCAQSCIISMEEGAGDIDKKAEGMEKEAYKTGDVSSEIESIYSSTTGVWEDLINGSGKVKKKCAKISSKVRKRKYCVTWYDETVEISAARRIIASNLSDTSAADKKYR